jgi:predicted RNase H-like HicB family nuclease
VLTEYIRAAMSHAEFWPLEDGSIYGEIPGVQGVWANAPSREEAERELREVLEDWLILNLQDHLPIPEIDGIALPQAQIA